LASATTTTAAAAAPPASPECGGAEWLTRGAKVSYHYCSVKSGGTRLSGDGFGVVVVVVVVVVVGLVCSWG
jgi:hypothetical protein